MIGIVEIQQFVAGRWGAGSGEPFERRDPTRPDVVLSRGRESAVVDAEAAVRSARSAQPSWAAWTPHARAEILRTAAAIVSARAEEWGEELAREEGKTRPEGVGEVRRAAQILEYAAGEPDRAAGEVYHSPRAGERILVSRRPLGVVAVIAPFNFPIAIPAWKIAPALVHGNAVVFKASGAVPVLAMRLVEALVEAGVPAGVLHLLHGDGAAAVRPWSRSRTSTVSASPVPPRWAGRSRRPGRAAESPSRPRWAGRTPRSSSTMPTSISR